MENLKGNVVVIKIFPFNTNLVSLNYLLTLSMTISGL